MQDKIPRELTWGLVGTFVGSALLWLLTNLKSGVLGVIFACWTIVGAVYSYRRSRKEGNSAGKTAAVLIIAIVVLVSLGFGAHALVEAATK
jgi:uncharacterized membrane protein YfcA